MAKAKGDAPFLPPITVDPEFEKLCPSLQASEFELLEAGIKRDGCLYPVLIWVDPKDPRRLERILDGHNRYKICNRHGIAFRTKALVLPDRNAARNWVIDHQLGRRNLNEKQVDYLKGQRRIAEKLGLATPPTVVAPIGHGVQSEDKKTSEKPSVAEQEGVSTKTLDRQAKFADAVDTITKKAGDTGLRDSILTGEVSGSRADIAKLAEAPASVVKRAARDVAAGKIDSIAEALPQPEPEDEGKRPCADALALLKKHKIPATEKQLEGLSEYQPDSQVDLIESVAAGRQTLAKAIETGEIPEPGLKEVLEEHNSEIESFCRRFLAMFESECPDNKWTQQYGRRDTARQAVKSACATIRTAKLKCECPKCNGEGCSSCLNTGLVNSTAYDQMGGKK